jgi:putative SOS response-associated peptidase YedK
MCGRYDLHNHPGTVALMLGLPYPQDILPRYNIAPTQDIPVVRVAANGQREMVSMRWGFVPRWARDPAIGQKMINARGETVATNKAFGIAFKRHRCLIPADGFYEWVKLAGGRKQPMRVTMKDGTTFAFGGIAERWLSPEGEVLDSCAIITVGSNELLAPIHERMPVIIAPDAYERWLDSTIESPLDLLAPYPSDAMRVYPVSTRVNATRNDDAALIEAVEMPLPESAGAQRPRNDIEKRGQKEVPDEAANKPRNITRDNAEEMPEEAAEDAPRQDSLF